MPKYTYRCDECEKVFEVVHSITKKLESCEECDGLLVRIPSVLFIIPGHTKTVSPHKVGDLVRNHIEETKNELRKEKERISSEEYK